MGNYVVDQTDKKISDDEAPQPPINSSVPNPKFLKLNLSSRSLPRLKLNIASSNKSGSSLQSVCSPMSPSTETSNCEEDPRPLLSSKIVKIAANFWNLKINALSFEQQLELSVSIYLEMMVKDTSIRAIFKQNCDSPDKISNISSKFLNMLGWLIRTLFAKDARISAALSALGRTHRLYGVRVQHFQPMVQALHESFAFYFPTEYGTKEKYAIDYIFMFATKMMMDEGLPLQCGDTDYLKNLSACLESAVGREYLFRYLQQNWCDEMVIYLQSVTRFKQQMSDKGRFVVARSIVEVSIHTDSDVSLNISHELRSAVRVRMDRLQRQFQLKENMSVSSNLFDEVDHAICRLIYSNYWRAFKDSITSITV